MSATLIGWLLGGAGAILFVVWIVRRNKKFGRQEVENENLSEFAESIDGINDMERIQDEKDSGDITDLADAGDFVDGLPDEGDDR